MNENIKDKETNSTIKSNDLSINFGKIYCIRFYDSYIFIMDGSTFTIFCVIV